ncbi:MAG: hypothetical protein LBP38_02890 [Desulfovibrio sp.]|jgi:hypothetical protein|nr:hypothetical protein [Desulfovibrio sp.]
MASGKKGYLMEEILRTYFRRLDYFVVRGVPVYYKDFSITDIDIFAYKRNSPISKQITIVDAKNKKTPQALERIFWVYGLKSVIGATSAIVATTDKRKEVIEYGKKLDILVFDGNFIDRLKNKYLPEADRFSEDDFFSEFDRYKLGKLDGDWRGRFVKSKACLAVGLNFDSCNTLLEQAHFFACKVLTHKIECDIAARCFYLVCAYISICIDYILKDLSFLEHHERYARLIEGLAYGTKGEAGTKKMLNMATDMVKSYVPDGNLIIRQIKLDIDKNINQLHVNILAEFFANQEVMSQLFQIAIEFESLAMRTIFTSHNSGSSSVKGLVGCLLDFWKIDRKKFSEATNSILLSSQKSKNED